MNQSSLDYVTSLYGGYWNCDFQDSCYMTNSYFPPDDFIDLLASNLRTLIQAYPSTNRQISSLVGALIGVEGQKVVVGNGASELISAITGSLIKNVAIPMPAFEEYPNRAQVLGKQVSPFMLSGDFHLDVAEFVAHVQNSGANSAIIVNPNNPTGTVLTRDEITALVRSLSHLDLVLIDESFIEFSQVSPNPSIVDLVDTYPNLMIIKSMSKNYGVPGLRLGYIVSGNAAHIERIRQSVSIWSINSIAQSFLENLDRYQTQFLESCEHVVAATQKLFHDLEAIPGVTPYPTEGNYVLCQLDTNMNGTHVATMLLDQFGVLISDRSNKGGLGPNFIRIASRTEKENERLITALGTICSSMGTVSTAKAE
jgi:threonine-phosphate decarboxylase